MTLKEFIQKRIEHNESRLKQIKTIPESKRTIHAVKEISYYEGKIDALDMVLGEIEKIIKKKKSC